MIEKGSLLNEKIRKDLETLENELSHILEKTKSGILKLRNNITLALNDPNVDLQEKEYCKQHIEALEESSSVYGNLVAHFSITKSAHKHLSPVLNMGGYRSLIVCLIDSLSKTIRLLELTSQPTMFSRSKQAVSTFFLRNKNSQKSLVESRGDQSNILIPKLEQKKKEK